MQATKALGHDPEFGGHDAEFAGHDPETDGHDRPKYARSSVALLRDGPQPVTDHPFKLVYPRSAFVAEVHPYPRHCAACNLRHDFPFPIRLNFRKSILIPRYRLGTGEVPSYSLQGMRRQRHAPEL